MYYSADLTPPCEDKAHVENEFCIESNSNVFFSVTGMPKEKYDPPDPRRMYTIMSTEEAANGKKSYWAELEIVGNIAYTYRAI